MFFSFATFYLNLLEPIWEKLEISQILLV